MIKLAASGVTHWHALYDAAYLPLLHEMSAVRIVALLQAVLARWQRGDKPLTSADDCYRAIRLVDDAYAWARRGGVVRYRLF